MGEGAPVLARRDNVLRQVAALEVNINRSRSRSKGTVRAKGKEMGPKKGKDSGGGKGDKGRSTIVLRRIPIGSYDYEWIADFSVCVSTLETQHFM